MRLTLNKNDMIKTFDQYLKDSPIVFPDSWTEAEKQHGGIGGIYVPVARLQKFWEWANSVQNALIAGKNLPHTIVEYYLENPYSMNYALPPSRRKDYPDLAKRFPICYEYQPDGSLKLV